MPLHVHSASEHASLPLMQPRCGTRHLCGPQRSLPSLPRPWLARGTLIRSPRQGSLPIRAWWRKDAPAPGADGPDDTAALMDTGVDAASQFDVRRAILLGQCAFEAYGEPRGSRLADVAVDGTWVTYADKGFVGEAFSGVLEVQAVGSEGTPQGADARLQVFCRAGFAEARGKAAGSGVDWSGARARVFLPRGESRVRVRVVGGGGGPLSPETLVGDAYLDIAELRDRMDKVGPFAVLQLPSEHTAMLRGPKGPAGTVRLQLRLYPFDPTVTWDPPKPIAELLRRLPFGEKQEEGPMESGWQALAAAVRDGFLVPAEYVPVAFVENEQSDTQVWVYRDRPLKEVVVSFRGTEQVKWKDLLTDLNLMPVGLEPEGAAASTPTPLDLLSSAASAAAGLLSNSPKAPTSSEEAPLMVHRGFLEAYDSVKVRVGQLVDALVGDGKDWKVLVTGHSLGGALATLAAYDLATRTAADDRPRLHVEMYNFGSPRVGNARFAAEFNRAVPTAFRVTNSRDIICTVPKLLGYAHVGTEVRLSGDGSLSIGGRTVLDGEETAQLAEKLTEEFLGRGNEVSKGQLERIVEEEMAILRNLADGSALSEHMEDCYLNALQLAVTGGVVPGQEQKGRG